MVRQGEIWLADLTPTVGSEITKTRPCVIMSGDDIGILPLKIVAPITDYKSHYDRIPWMVKLVPDKLNNLSKPSVIDLFQLRSLSNQRIVKKVGSVSAETFKEALDAVKTVFGMYR